MRFFVPQALALGLCVILCSGCSMLGFEGGSARDAGTRASVYPAANSRSAGRPGDTFKPDVTPSHPPFEQFHASWKQRIDQPYVYVESYGSYTEAPARLPGLLWELKQQGLAAESVPFILYYDDPGTTAVDQLRARVCVPIRGERSPLAPLRYDVLASRSVAYAFVSGSYMEVPRSYPKLFDYLHEKDWQLDGPILERYIVNPNSVDDPRDLLCEVQFPFRSKR